jgi:biotin synthase
VERIGKELGLETCASLGTLSAADAQYLVSRGLRRVHHNLETSRSFFPNVCTTTTTTTTSRRSGSPRRPARGLLRGGLRPGRVAEDRVELALTLRELDVDSIPANFLNPIPGTPVEGRRELTPIGCLRILANAAADEPGEGAPRLRRPRGEPALPPAADVRAGASGAMAGNYLTTAGRPAEEDLRMVEDLGLKPQNRDVDEFSDKTGTEMGTAEPGRR